MRLTLALLALALFSLASYADSGITVPLSVREYIAEQYFPGVDAASPQLDAAIEVLTVPPAILRHIRDLGWERGQLERYAADKLFLLVSCPNGSVRALHFRRNEIRNDRELDASRVRVLHRLYSDTAFTAPPAPELNCWLWRDSIDAKAVFLHAASVAARRRGPILDAATLERAHGNLTAPGTHADALARALGALADSSGAPENCWAALWLLSRLDQMSFAREQRELSVCDLRTAEAQAFYENVFYAVKARRELPWARSVPDEDFLQQVLSPRGTGEPLQRWRRHFYEALAPEVHGFGARDIDRAIAVATNAYGDYFQYEGDTTWEDFGLLTSLAVHEGRCEDCSNVLNAMLRTLGIPACQAYTPWWGNGDGNHAWTWIRGFGEVPADGANGVKVYVKTWDGKLDVTAGYTPVTTVEFATAVPDGTEAELLVWNHDDWRVVAQERAKCGAVRFENVGCRLNFALCIRVPDEPERIADVRTGGSVRWLNLDPATPAEGGFTALLDAINALGEFKPDADYTLERYTLDGWQQCPSERTPSSAISFAAHPGFLYRILGEGVAPRPFTVELDPATGGTEILRR